MDQSVEKFKHTHKGRTEVMVALTHTLSLSLIMPMPRRLNYVIHETTGDHSFVIQRNDLTHEQPEPPPTDFDTFPSLSCALGALKALLEEKREEKKRQKKKKGKGQMLRYVALSALLGSFMPDPQQ